MIKNNKKCIFMFKRTGQQCTHRSIQGYEYCQKHKRYSYGKKKVINNKVKQKIIEPEDNYEDIEDDNQNIEIIPEIKVDDPLSNINMDKLDEEVVINRSECLNKHETIVHVSSKNVDDIEQLNTDDFKHQIDDNETEISPEMAGEIMTDLTISSAQMVETICNRLKSKTKVTIEGFSDDVNNKRDEYKRTYMKYYDQNSDKIDEHITPTKVLLAMLLVSIAKTVNLSDDFESNNEKKKQSVKQLNPTSCNIHVSTITPDV